MYSDSFRSPDSCGKPVNLNAINLPIELWFLASISGKIRDCLFSELTFGARKTVWTYRERTAWEERHVFGTMEANDHRLWATNGGFSHRNPQKPKALPGVVQQKKISPVEPAAISRGLHGGWRERRAPSSLESAQKGAVWSSPSWKGSSFWSMTGRPHEFWGSILNRI